MSKTFKLKLTSAVVIASTPTPAGSLVDVEDALARRLLATGKAELATQDDVDLAEAGEPDTDVDANADVDPASQPINPKPAPANARGKPKGEAK